MARAAWLAQYVGPELVKTVLPVRARNSHKGDYGKILLLCGSTGLTGSTILAAKAAVRTGSGLVYLGVPESVYPICRVPVPQAGRFSASVRCGRAAQPRGKAEIERRMEHMDAVLLGPGLGRSEEITALVRWLLGFCHKPLVLTRTA